MYLKIKRVLNDGKTHEFELINEEGVAVGFIQIRMEPSPGPGLPSSFSSHIYYEIYPEYRRAGLGYKILSLGLAKAENLGLKEVVLTVEDSNTASVKIIESNGGVLEDKTKAGTEQKVFSKYKILL